MRLALQEWQVSLDNDVVLRGIPPARWIAFRLTALRWSQEGAVGAEDDVAPSVPVPPRIFEPPKRCANRLAARRPPPAAPLALNDALPGPGRGGWCELAQRLGSRSCGARHAPVFDSSIGPRRLDHAPRVLGIGSPARSGEREQERREYSHSRAGAWRLVGGERWNPRLLAHVSVKNTRNHKA